MHPIIVRDERSRSIAIELIGKLNLSKAWEVVIRPRKSKRSLDQNALYHKWVSIVADETGNTHDAIHEWAKAQFLPPRLATVGGVVKEYRPSTTKLTVAEMSDYMTRFSAWAATDLGLALPHPDDLGRAA